MVDGSEYRFISGSKKIRSTRIGIDSVLDSRSVCSLVKTGTLAQDEVNQEESEQNEVDRTKKGADSTGKVIHI